MKVNTIFLIQIGRYALCRIEKTLRFFVMKAEKKDERGDWNYWHRLGSRK